MDSVPLAVTAAVVYEQLLVCEGGMTLKHLVRPQTEIDFPVQVAAIWDEMKKTGFTASAADIAWAYGEYSEDHWCCSWIDLSAGIVSVEDAAKGVISYLVEPSN